jgi:hypothetical protein
MELFENDTARLTRERDEARKERDAALSSLNIALYELIEDNCSQCGYMWRRCECPNGEWWRAAWQQAQQSPEAKKLKAFNARNDTQG